MEQAEVKATVLDFLKRHVKMVLGINEAGSYPNTSLMHYAAGEDLTVYIGTKRGFGKYNALKADPKVTFVVVEESIDPLRVVDARGIARELNQTES